MLVVYFSRHASQLSVYQSRDYHVYIPNSYQTRPVAAQKRAYCNESVRLFACISQKPYVQTSPTFLLMSRVAVAPLAGLRYYMYFRL